MSTFKNYIAGEWVDSSDGKTFENSNPATGEVIGHFPSATADDTQRAIAAAKAALPKWANLPGPSRGAILDKASQIIDARLSELAETLTREEGKTLAESEGRSDARPRHLQVLRRRRLSRRRRCAAGQYTRQTALYAARTAGRDRA